jgi:2-polyprenyl-3-methyl-5-hydroxy-6-metoxy-1,4-benzoquinol methylase
VSAPLEDADVETASAGYARRFDSRVGEWMLATQMGITLDLLRDFGNASLLDVGGGHGQVAPTLAHGGLKVSVLASSPAAVGARLSSCVDSGLVDLLTGDLRRPPVEARSFDVVLSYRLLAHARDLSALIAGLTGPARRAVIVDYATSRSFNAAAALLFTAKKSVEHNTRAFVVMKDQELAALFAKEGFALRARRPQFFWPMALHRALKTPTLSRGLEGLARILGLRALFGSPVIARFDRV